VAASSLWFILFIHLSHEYVIEIAAKLFSPLSCSFMKDELILWETQNNEIAAKRCQKSFAFVEPISNSIMIILRIECLWKVTFGWETMQFTDEVYLCRLRVVPQWNRFIGGRWRNFVHFAIIACRYLISLELSVSCFTDQEQGMIR
jgi:hypothetical protein